MKIKYAFIFLLLPFDTAGQNNDSLNIQVTPGSVKKKAVFLKPPAFSFITNIPKDITRFTKQSFQKKQYKYLAVVAGATVSLIFADQAITNTLQSNFRKAGIHATENYSPIIQVNAGGRKTTIGKIPHNVNTAFYNFGQGSSTMLMAALFFSMGKIKQDNRALQTASQLTEAFIVLGAATQLIKYTTGRENPAVATASGGKWRPFPSWSNFQHNKPTYDAFPSGHLATFVSTVTIIGENYPEIKWIKPVGYSLAGLICLSMINNGVHWMSDYPLGLALGYGFGRFISRRSHHFSPIL